MRALMVAMTLAALAGCSSLPPVTIRYAGHDHDGAQLELECEGCARAVQGVVLRTIQAATTAPQRGQESRPTATPAAAAPPTHRDDAHSDPEETP